MVLQASLPSLFFPITSPLSTAGSSLLSHGSKKPHWHGLNVQDMFRSQGCRSLPNLGSVLLWEVGAGVRGPLQRGPVLSITEQAKPSPGLLDSLISRAVHYWLRQTEAFNWIEKQSHRKGQVGPRVPRPLGQPRGSGEEENKRPSQRTLGWKGGKLSYLELGLQLDIPAICASG